MVNSKISPTMDAKLVVNGQLSELEQTYRARCAAETDINEHLPVLRKLAESCQHVTEFGTRAGNSTVAFLAAQPKRLVSYDMVEQPVVAKFREHAGKTNYTFRRENVLKATIEETDALFIDTWHVCEQLRAELKLHAGKARRWIVLHDTTSYGEKGETCGHRGLWPAVEEFLERGTFKVFHRATNNNGLTILKRCASESAAKVSTVAPAQVYIAVPYYQGFVGPVVDSHKNLMDNLGASEDCGETWYSGSAFHCGTFNELLANCFNSLHLGWTHFAMIHSDVRPSGFAMSTLLHEMRKYGADVISAVLPIKTHHGWTSTALLERATGKVHRLTKDEVIALPCATFDAAMIGRPDCDLLVSDGLWICDLRRGFLQNFTGFESRHRLIRLPATDSEPERWKAENVSEDWIFSAQMRRMGAKIMATRAVPCGHWGLAEYRNDVPGGTEKADVPEAYGDWFSWQS